MSSCFLTLDHSTGAGFQRTHNVRPLITSYPLTQNVMRASPSISHTLPEPVLFRHPQGEPQED